jgi:hypothetical protein
LLGGFAGELGALKAQLYAFTVGAVADSAKLVSLGIHPALPFGQLPFCIFGHFSQTIPQTPIFILKPQ